MCTPLNCFKKWHRPKADYGSVGQLQLLLKMWFPKLTHSLFWSLKLTFTLNKPERISCVFFCYFSRILAYDPCLIAKLIACLALLSPLLHVVAATKATKYAAANVNAERSVPSKWERETEGDWQREPQWHTFKNRVDTQNFATFTSYVSFQVSY